MFDKLGSNLLNKNRFVAASTPNLAVQRGSEFGGGFSSGFGGGFGGGLQRSTAGLYDSLMRLDDLDDNATTTALINSLVPTNQAPVEKQYTVSKISTTKGSVKVTKSSSISDLAPCVLRPKSSNNRR